MQKYVSFVIYPTVQNVEINKEHFLRKEVIYQNLSGHLKKRMMMKMKIVTEIYARFVIENFILSKYYLKKTFKLNLKQLEFQEKKDSKAKLINTYQTCQKLRKIIINPEKNINPNIRKFSFKKIKFGGTCVKKKKSKKSLPIRTQNICQKKTF